MTIHGAKGLDFGHVYLLQLHRESGGGEDRVARVVRLDGTPEYGLFGWPTPGLQRALAWQERVADAELVRLLYVAATRAKQRLVLAGDRPEEGRVRGRRGRRLVDLLQARGWPDDVDSAGAPAGRAVDPDGVHWVDPALALQPPAAALEPPGDEPEPPSLARIAREARLLAVRREAAAARMARPLAGAATAEVERQLGREQWDEGADGPVAEVPREVAAAVGTVVHHLLETLDLDRELPPQVAERRGELEARLGRELGPAEQAAGATHLGQLLARLAGGRLLERLERLAPRVVARELPLLLPPSGESGPLGFVAARVDLVVGDPESGELVVVDYKTDAAADDAALAVHAARYAPQVELYCRGLQAALDLDRPPRGELWFLAADEVVAVPVP
jgi:ATP-dependent helicase/nuclease subunit A